MSGHVMTRAVATKDRGRSRIHRWARRGFLVWAVVSTSWLVNSVRTRGVDEETLRSSPEVSVVDSAATLEFLPARSESRAALVFLCGPGVAAQAYAPLLRPIAEAGYAVFVVKLPYRFAPFESHRRTAMGRAGSVIASNDGIAPPDRVLSNKGLLPEHTTWVEIEGGNHSQFGHYGHQLFDGEATVSREAQQAATRSALLEALVKAAG